MLRRFLILLMLASAGFCTSIDFTVEERTCPDDADFLHVLFNLPTCIVEKFFSTIVSGFVYSAGEFLENSLDFIVNGPDLALFCGPFTEVMRILESLYTIALMGVGAYYIATSADPEKRARAKLWLQNILFLIIALSFSYGIFELIMELNEYITLSLFDSSFSDLLDIEVVFSSLVFAMILSVNFLLSASVTFFTLLMRYMLIPFLLLLFPVALFLFFMPFTRAWGMFLIQFILIIVFMTSVDAILILGMSYLLSSGDPLLSTGFVQGIALMLGFGLIGFLNVLIYLVATFSLISAIFRILSSVAAAGWRIAMLLALL